MSVSQKAREQVTTNEEKMDNINKICKRENGVMIITDNDGSELHLLTDGRVVLKGVSNSYLMFESMADYPDNIWFRGAIDSEDHYRPNGSGLYNYKNDASKPYSMYVGGVEAGFWCGNGVLTYKNGDELQGLFSRYERIGWAAEGKLTTSCGDIICGVWQNGVVTRIDLVTFPGGSLIYDVTPLEDRHDCVDATFLLQGQGTYRGLVQKDGYEFYPVNGVMQFLDGRVYKGTCSSFKKDSGGFKFFCRKGTMTLPNGISYAGMWAGAEISPTHIGTLCLVGNDKGVIQGPPNDGLMKRYLDPTAFSTNNEEEEGEEGEEGEEEEEEEEGDSDSDEELLHQKRLPRTFTVAEDNIAENLKQAKICGGCREVMVEDNIDRWWVCSACDTQYYCSGGCQHKHWPNHKKVCKKKKEEDSDSDCQLEGNKR